RSRVVAPPIIFLSVTSTSQLYTLSLHDALPISSNTKDWDDARSHYREVFVFVDHSPLGWPQLDLDGFIAIQQSYVDEVHVTSVRSEEHTSELQSQSNLVCRLLLEKKKKNVGAPR